MKKRKRNKEDNRIMLFVILILFIGFGILFIKYHLRQSEITPLVVFPPSIPPAPAPTPAGAPDVSLPRAKSLVAIIIDDFGYSLNPNVKGFIELDYPLTLAILPKLSHSMDIALLAEMAEKEVILHLPMEPYGYPQAGKNPGEGAIFCNLPPEKIRERVRENLKDLPQAVGLNIHMGSRASEETGVMSIVLDEVKKDGLYFVDSLTTKNSVGLKLAKEKGIRAARRDIFLDNKDDPAYINSQLDKLIREAKKEGSAIGVGHVYYKSTLDVLKRRLPELDKEGVKLVFASQIVE